MCQAIEVSKSSVKPLLPNRIIEIVVDRRVRLKESIAEKADYACLSHFWGDANILVTEAATLQERLNEIAWDELPRTFQDAVTFLQLLGIRYVWIDSLCIIEESEDDWLKQSGAMSDIYSAASITIAATKAADRNAGLFSIIHEVALAYERPRHVGPLDIEEDGYSLLTRGWAAQDIMLSPRVLHFCNQEMVYNCMQEAFCSCCMTDENPPVYGLRDPIWSMDTSTVSNVSKRGSSLDFDRFDQIDDSHLVHFYEWSSMLEKYSTLKLTFENDRFPAISGLARLFSKRSKANYAAGLWVEDLHNGLHWARKSDAWTSQTRLDVNAPTWSPLKI